MCQNPEWPISSQRNNFKRGIIFADAPRALSSLFSMNKPKKELKNELIYPFPLGMTSLPDPALTLSRVKSSGTRMLRKVS
jgi:hypothetical protein